jgi:hypothetical protein
VPSRCGLPSAVLPLQRAPAMGWAAHLAALRVTPAQDWRERRSSQRCAVRARHLSLRDDWTESVLLGFTTGLECSSSLTGIGPISSRRSLRRTAGLRRLKIASTLNVDAFAGRLAPSAVSAQRESYIQCDDVSPGTLVAHLIDGRYGSRSHSHSPEVLGRVKTSFAALTAPRAILRSAALTRPARFPG